MRFLEAEVFKFKIPQPEKAGWFGNVMELAIVDRNNPLAWAVLGHEFGHFLDERAKITERAVQEFAARATETPLGSESIKALQRVCAEIVADVTGYYLNGPCGILPLVNMLILVGCTREQPIEFDGEHGAPTTRVAMVQSLCKIDGIETPPFDVQFDTLVEEERLKSLSLTNDQQEERKQIHDFLTQFLEQVRPTIMSELAKMHFTRFTSDHYACAKDLSRLLADGLPIGATASHPREEARKHLLSASSGKDAREKYYLLKDRAVTVGEVITAGWRNRLTHTLPRFSKAFAQPTQDEVFSNLAVELEGEDNLLFKSIDMIPMLEARRASPG